MFTETTKLARDGEMGGGGGWSMKVCKDGAQRPQTPQGLLGTGRRGYVG